MVRARVRWIALSHLGNHVPFARAHVVAVHDSAHELCVTRVPFSAGEHALHLRSSALATHICVLSIARLIHGERGARAIALVAVVHSCGCVTSLSHRVVVAKHAHSYGKHDHATHALVP